jgi:hypothetical protein
VFTAYKSSNQSQQRGNFLSRTAAVGGMATLGASAGPVQAAKTLTKDSPGTSPKNKAIWPGNATANNFSRHIDNRFRLRTEHGTTSYATLVEGSSTKIRHALRFRREHFLTFSTFPAASN